MITQEIVDYVKGQLASGISEDVIKANLLSQGGWTVEQVDEVFKTINQPMGAEAVSLETDPVNEQPPKSITYFVWAMYASFVLSLIGKFIPVLSYDLQLALLVLVMPLLMIFIKLVCVRRIVSQRSEVTRIVLTIIVGFGLLFSILTLVVAFFKSPLMLVEAPALILEILALYFLFTKDSNSWIVAKSTQSQVNNAESTENIRWTKTIPGLNKKITIVATIIFLVEFILVGGPLAFSNSWVGPFAVIMVCVLALLGGFNYFESTKLAKKYATSHSNLDGWFVLLTTFRNVTLILNVLPFIQLLGIAALVFGGIPYLIVYILLVLKRNKSVPKV